MEKKKKRTVKRPVQKDGSPRIPLRIAVGTLAGGILFFTLLTAGAYVVCRRDPEPNVYGTLMLALCAVSAGVCGCVTVLPVRRSGLVLGMLSVLPLFLVIAAAAAFVQRAPLGVTGWSTLGAMLACGGIGGVLAANRKKKKKL